jgi:plastocyanin
MVRGTTIWFWASSSERHAHLQRRVHATRYGVTTLLATVAVLSLGSAPRSLAQGSVAGVIALDERRDAERGDLRDAVIWLEPKSRLVPVNDVPQMRSASISMRGREFIPHVRVVLAGGSVAFPNEDPFSHNVFSNVDLGPFDLGLYRRGATRAANFPRPGVYPIYCNIHSKMVSFVVAVPAPYATQPDENGRFVLPSVPAGAYTLRAWHEHGASELQREIVVPGTGLAQLQLTIDARTYVDAPHYNKFGRPYAVIRADKY